MSRRTLTLVIPALLLIIAACGSDDDSDDAGISQEPTPASDVSPTEEPDPTPTAEPEPTATPEEPDGTIEEEDDHPATEDQAIEEDDTFVEQHGLGDDPIDGVDDPFGEVPAVHMEDFHDPDLSVLLLDVEQMPEGWDVMGEGSLPEDAQTAQGLGDMMSGPCGNEMITPEQLANPVHAGRYFIGPDFGPFFNQDIFAFDDEGAAVDAMEIASSQLDCDGWTAQDPETGIEMEYTVEELDLPDIGDETVAVALSIGVASDDQAGTQFDELFGDMGAEAVLVRQGNVLSSFTHMNWFGGAEIDIEEIVTLAADRIDGHE